MCVWGPYLNLTPGRPLPRGGDWLTFFCEKKGLCVPKMGPKGRKFDFPQYKWTFFQSDWLVFWKWKVFGTFALVLHQPLPFSGFVMASFPSETPEETETKTKCEMWDVVYQLWGPCAPWRKVYCRKTFAKPDTQENEIATWKGSKTFIKCNCHVWGLPLHLVAACWLFERSFFQKRITTDNCG